MIASLPIEIVFCISVTILSQKSSFWTYFLVLLTFLEDRHQRLITISTTLTLNLRLLSHFECKLSVIGSLFQLLLFYIILLQAFHIIYPYSFRLLLFNHQIWSCRCCYFLLIELKVPY